ncbi:cobalamin biosynthesis Mg chelatase CobN [Paenarthrobacter nitroguajacolicus]|uniref:hypothetical protein n=1 Tax=Paenarthrobacter TaxID=1742992 RepID=UPI00285D58BC|nr:hypothetical protein [Paenarthrobacter nitroguajacolicus]MDR6988403.1 cobalamin biosynthesis Mg chelatase CobN [Paenarthrobacter nitroguajacolicus]
MFRRLATTTLALALCAGPMVLTAVPASAATVAQGSVAATTPTPTADSTNPSGPSTQTPTNPAPSSGAPSTPNPAGSGPANPGTGESDPQEQTRTDVTPWVLAGVAAIILIALIIWTLRNRRGRDKGISDPQR